MDLERDHTLLPLASLEALEVRERDGTIRRYTWVGGERVSVVKRPTPRTLQHEPQRTKAQASWSIAGSFLLVVVPTGRTLPRELRPGPKRRRFERTPDKEAAAELWRAWAPGPAARAADETEQIQDIDLSGPWASIGHATLVDYFSDKFNGRHELQAYRHVFDRPPRVERMEAATHRAYVLRGPGLKVTGDGIEG